MLSIISLLVLVRCVYVLLLCFCCVAADLLYFVLLLLLLALFLEPERGNLRNKTHRSIDRSQGGGHPRRRPQKAGRLYGLYGIDISAVSIERTFGTQSAPLDIRDSICLYC
jgi:hypothetical protein